MLKVHVVYFRGSKAGKPTIELNSQPVGMERIGKNVVVGCMDETLQCYTSKVLGAVFALCKLK